MTIHQSIEIFVAINLFAIGLSHFAQPKIWVEFFTFLHQKEYVGNTFNALLALGMGSFIVSFYWVWSWPKLLITGYGLSQVFKGIVYLVFPAIGLKSIGKITNGTSQKFRWVGLIMCLWSLWIAFGLITSGSFN